MLGVQQRLARNSVAWRAPQGLPALVSVQQGMTLLGREPSPLQKRYSPGAAEKAPQKWPLLGSVERRLLAAVLHRHQHRLRTAAVHGLGIARRSTSTRVAALTLLSSALRDPDTHVRATLRQSPQPNSMQKQKSVLAYLDVDRPADACRGVEDAADWHGHTGLPILAEVLKRMGQFERSAPMLQRVFAQTLEVDALRTWLGHLAPPAHASALEHARELASTTTIRSLRTVCCSKSGRWRRPQWRVPRAVATYSSCAMFSWVNCSTPAQASKRSSSSP
jgi:hypothetical protein